MSIARGVLQSSAAYERRQRLLHPNIPSPNATQGWKQRQADPPGLSCVLEIALTPLPSFSSVPRPADCCPLDCCRQSRGSCDALLGLLRCESGSESAARRSPKPVQSISGCWFVGTPPWAAGPPCEQQASQDWNSNKAVLRRVHCQTAGYAHTCTVMACARWLPARLLYHWQPHKTTPVWPHLCLTWPHGGPGRRPPPPTPNATTAVSLSEGLCLLASRRRRRRNRRPRKAMTAAATARPAAAATGVPQQPQTNKESVRACSAV